MILNKNSPKYRELLWRACCLGADGLPATDGTVTCNLCQLPVQPGSDWDESHGPIPKAFGGAAVWIAHRRCNREHGAQVVTPMIAKAKRQERKHVGITRPGLGKTPLPCGRNTGFKKTMRHGVVKRMSQSAMHREMVAKRNGGGE